MVSWYVRTWIKQSDSLQWWLGTWYFANGFEMWCWRRMVKITWTERVRNEVLYRVKEVRNMLHTVKRRKFIWIGHIWRRNRLLKDVIEGKIEGMTEMKKIRWRRRKQLLDDLNKTRRYWELYEEALYRTLWRNCSGTGYGPVVRQSADWLNEWMDCVVIVYLGRYCV
jgi:hypothetical protein